MNKLIEEAIADAKAVKSLAIENAKATLTEAFMPKIQSMLSTHLSEEEDEDLPEEELTPEEEPTPEEAPEEAPAPEEASAPEESPESEEEVGDEDDDLDLEAIIKELEDEEDAEVEDEMPEEEPTEEGLEMGSGGGENEDEDEDELNVDEIIEALKTMNEEESCEKEKEEKKDEKMEERLSKTKNELHEALQAIKSLRKSLSEVNLLNSKLLYVNKLFRLSGFTEAQKTSIVEAIDRANTVREAKLIYVTLTEQAKKITNKKRVTEGLASRPMKKTVITESNEAVKYLQQLAGII